MKKASSIQLEFIKKQKVSENTYSFIFKREDFEFISGQYVKLFLDIKNPDSRGSSRNITISSSPTDKEFIVLTTKVIKSSFKKRLFDLSSGEKIKAFGPIGYFDFDPKINKNIVLLAGGIGITPFYSLIKLVNDKEIKTNVTLIASFEKKEDILFFNDLDRIQKDNSLINIIFTLTKEENSNFETGRISDKLIKKHVQNLEKQKFYIVGSSEMVENIYSVVEGLGISENNIFKEDFTGY